MKASGRANRSFLFALVATLLLVFGHADAATSCHKINAKAIGQDNFDLTTRATILGGGLLNGTTASTLSVAGVEPPDLLFAGTIVVTTKHGALTAAIMGTIDTSTGEFSATANVTSGTGKLEGATGMLSFEGVEDLATGRFAEDIAGVVCADLSP
jgi:hypothetical protein